VSDFNTFSNLHCTCSSFSRSENYFNANCFSIWFNPLLIFVNFKKILNCECSLLYLSKHLIKYTVFQRKSFFHELVNFQQSWTAKYFTSLLKVCSFRHLISNWILYWHNDLTKTLFFRFIPLFNFSCYYITLDSATAASPNRFWSRKLSFHGKTNIIQNMTKG
jgi:hypothetical protein